MKYTHPIRLLTVFLFLLALLGAGSAHAAMLSISGDNINLRSGPGSKYRILWELSRGYPLEILKRDGDWYRVRDFEGTVGWVHREAVGDTPYMIVKTNRKTRKPINLRSGPGESNEIVAKARYGVVLQTLEQKNGWVKVRHEQGVTGWVRRDLLWGW